jgi:mono/diheme cytochrome c family protein
MKQRVVANIALIGLSVIRLSAQGSKAEVVPNGPAAYVTATSLTAVQQEGQRMFMQRCSICHTPGTPTGRHIGPVLKKDRIVGKEEAVRQVIMAGTDRMPGYRYGLSPAQITAVIEYLKTGMETTEVDQSGPLPAGAGKGKGRGN